MKSRNLGFTTNIEIVFIFDISVLAIVTSRKQDKGPPQRYQHEEDPIPILVPSFLYAGNIEVDGSLRRSFSTGW